MKTFTKFVESKKTNKFNIHWQIVRTKARKLKDVPEKINYVLEFLESNPNMLNYDRVLNWVKMTGVAYPKDSEQRQAFETMYNMLTDSREEYNDLTDNDNDLSKISTEDLQLVYKDLKSRKYGFQFKSVPADHTEFMENLEQELQKRK